MWTGRAGRGGRSREMCLRSGIPSRSPVSLRGPSTATVRTLPRGGSGSGTPSLTVARLKAMWMTIGSALLAGMVAAGSPVGPGGTAWVAPLETGLGELLQGFQRPVDRFAAGHRGVDLPATDGMVVLSIGHGTVTHVGDVAGVGSVTIDHGVVRSSYLPVHAVVAEGDEVSAGAVIGYVSGSHCPVACLHLGLRRPVWEAWDALSDPYLDPVAWIRRIPVLKPLT